MLHEANRTGGFGAEIVAQLHESLGNEMALKVVRVATPDMRIPPPLFSSAPFFPQP